MHLTGGPIATGRLFREEDLEEVSVIPALLPGTSEDRRASLADVAQAEPMQQAGQVERQGSGGLDGMKARWQVAPPGELVARFGASETAAGLVWVVRRSGAHRPTSSHADVPG